MKKDFLLEVLVQELPYKFIPSAVAQLKSSFEKLFNEQALTYGEIKVYATPRRLAVLVSDLSLSQDTLEKDVKGPILTIAKNEQGEYTPAAIGFAKKNGVEISALYEKDNYTVRYHGAVKAYKDKGIDVIVNKKRSKDVFLIQCKI